MSSLQIGCLGPKGSISEEVTLSIWKKPKLILFSSFFDLFRSFRDQEVEKIIVPFENAIGGSIELVFDSILELWREGTIDFTIEREIYWVIRHNLIGFGQISEVKIVYSHSQALLQCDKFLNGLKVKTEAVQSTSEAVRLIAERKDRELAAIGTERAAKIYHVPLIRMGIDDFLTNQTRFIVLGDERGRETGKDKTSFVFKVENKPGTLHGVLSVLADLEINMTMIVSRPSVHTFGEHVCGEYVFFADVEGHQNEEKLKSAFSQLQERTKLLIILGSYPQG